MVIWVAAGVWIWWSYLANPFLTVCSDADQRKHRSSASLGFVKGIHRWPVNSPHKWPVTRIFFPFDDFIMYWVVCYLSVQCTPLDWHMSRPFRHVIMWPATSVITPMQQSGRQKAPHLPWERGWWQIKTQGKGICEAEKAGKEEELEFKTLLEIIIVALFKYLVLTP